MLCIGRVGDGDESVRTALEVQKSSADCILKVLHTIGVDFACWVQLVVQWKDICICAVAVAVEQPLNVAS